MKDKFLAFTLKVVCWLYMKLASEESAAKAAAKEAWMKLKAFE